VQLRKKSPMRSLIYAIGLLAAASACVEAPAP
jgi:hypothetical protein